MKIKSIIVELDDKKVEVKKLPIGKYAEMLAVIKQLPKHFNTVDQLDTEKIIERIPELVGSALPDVLGLISIATDLTYQEVEVLGLNEIIDLVTAIFEVNNYSAVFEKIKKVMARTEVAAITEGLKPMKEIGSSGS